MSKVYRDLSTQENRRFWQSVESAAAEVHAWPAWKRVETQERKAPIFVLLAEKRSFLEGCELAAKEELQRRTEEIEIQKEQILSKLNQEIKTYRKQIKCIGKLIDKARKKSRQSQSPATGCLGDIRGMPYHMSAPHKCTLTNETRNQFGKDGFLKPKNKKN